MCEKLDVFKQNIQEHFKALENLKLSTQSNIEKLKESKSNFKNKFTNLLSELENLPTDLQEAIKKDEEDVSPASLISVQFWEWLYHPTESAKQFERQGDNYSLRTSQGYGNICAYSSIFASEGIINFKIKFLTFSSFGCGGFGVISMDDPKFTTTSFGSIQKYPQFCMCCTGAWSGAAPTRTAKFQSKSIQHVIKDEPNEDNRFIGFEINFPENLFKVYAPNEELFGTNDISNLEYKTNLCLYYYSGSQVEYTFELIFV